MLRFLLIMGINKKAKIMLKTGGGIALAMLALIGVALPAAAQSNGLGITPKESFTMKAGTQASNVLFLANLNKNQTLTVHLNVVDFTSLDETGSAKLLQGADQPQTPWSLKPFITIPDTVVVPAGGSKQIPFTLKLPANVGAGSYYSAIEYTASSGSGSQQITIAASTATLLFINVPGDVSELLSLKSFGMFNAKSNKFQSVFHSPPQYYSYRLENKGNLAESPAGSLIVKNAFGHIVARVDSANPKGQLALIGQTRRFQGCFPKSKAVEDLPKESNCTQLDIKPGLYTATLAIFYGQNGQQTREIGATSHFWYLPWSFIIELIVVIVLVIYFALKIRKRLHRRR